MPAPLCSRLLTVLRPPLLTTHIALRAPARPPTLQRANHSATLVERGGGRRELWVVGGQTNESVLRDVWVLQIDLDGRLSWRQVHVR